MQDHAELEDRRLTYVTLTRAKSRLIVSSHWWGPTQTSLREPNEMLTALREHCAADERNGEVPVWAPQPGEDERNPALGDGSETPWPLEPDGEARERRREAARAVVERMRAMAEAAEAARGAAVEGAAADGAAAAATGAAVAADAEVFASAEHRTVVEGWDADLDALLGELRRAREVRFEVAMPRTLSATRLVAYAADPDAFAEELFRPMPRPPAPQARRGTEFHAWVERRYGQQSLFDEADLDLFADEEDVDGSHDLTELKEAFLRSEYADREPYRIEAPFQILVAGQIVRGRIDAVYRDPDGSFEVVDWKTNRAADADPLQLAVYRLAWAELAGVPPDRVRAAFLYVRTGEVRRYGYDDLPDRTALERLVAGEAGGS